MKAIPPPVEATPKKERKYRPISPLRQSDRDSSVSSDYNRSDKDDLSSTNLDHKIEKT